MIKYIIKSVLFLCFVFFAGCETFDLDQKENPSTLNPSFLDPELAYNYVQLQLPNFVNSTNSFTQRVTRQMAMTSGNTYDNAFAPVNFDNNWSIGYNILNAVKMLEPKARANNDLFIIGATKLIRCYVILTLVDLYGDIPYSEALLGSQNLQPKFDKSSDVYRNILLEIDESISIFNQSPVSPEINLYYDNSDGWIKLANTLKLKIYNNSRLAPNEIGITDLGSAFSAIINSGKYIKEPSDDFLFNYGTSRFNPNTRHPLYNDQYEINGGAYISNYIMWAMTLEKKVDGKTYNDPRTNYYFYKQVANPSSFSADILPGRTRPSHYDDGKYSSFYSSSVLTPYTVSNWIGETSITSNGFWGRDHGNNSGIPQDDTRRTVAGVYPIGGNFDLIKFESVQKSGESGAKGEGIMPILLSSYVHFIIAEAYLTIPGSTSGDNISNAKAELLSGVDQSITKVTTFLPKETVLTSPQQTSLTNDIVDYKDFLSFNYDQFNLSKKLELVIKEYYLAAWGNGIEPYNNYRRTGYPSNFQPTLEPVSGTFFYTALYPASVANNNSNMPQNTRNKKVFWDKANLNLH